MPDRKPEYKNYIEIISLKSGDFFTCVKLFSDNPLRHTQYLKVSHLDDIMKHGYNMAIQPNLFKWEPTEDDSKRFIHDIDNSSVALKDILENDKGLQAYFREFYPEHAL